MSFDPQSKIGKWWKGLSGSQKGLVISGIVLVSALLIFGSC